MNGGYLLIDFSKYNPAEFATGVRIPGIWSSIKRARKPIVLKGGDEGVTFSLTYMNVTLFDNGNINIWGTGANGDIIRLIITNNDMVRVST